MDTSGDTADDDSTACLVEQPRPCRTLEHNSTTTLFQNDSHLTIINKVKKNKKIPAFYWASAHLREAKFNRTLGRTLGFKNDQIDCVINKSLKSSEILKGILQNGLIRRFGT